MTGSVTQDVEKVTDLSGHVSTNVNRRVPRATVESIKVTIAIAQDVFTSCERVGLGGATMEQSHLVTAIDGCLGHMATDETGTSDDQDAHALTVGVCRRPGPMEDVACVAGQLAGSFRSVPQSWCF